MDDEDMWLAAAMVAFVATVVMGFRMSVASTCEKQPLRKKAL
jgi:hypothetical protein